MTRERAYEILELEMDSSNDLIIKKYENLLRLAKTNQAYDEKLLFEAYAYLIGNPWQTASSKKNRYKKLDNFLYYNGKKIIIGVIVLAALIFFIILLSQKSGLNPFFGNIRGGNGAGF